MLKVHHLRVGRSIFTVWLLEELQLQYELEIYDRNDQGRAPPELRAAHPLGKSPVISVDGFTLAESGAITLYLLENYDKANLLGPERDGGKAWAEWMQWLLYSEASAFAPLLIKLLLLRSEQRPALLEGFAEGEVALQLGYINDRLAGRNFIMGDTLQAPDFRHDIYCANGQPPRRNRSLSKCRRIPGAQYSAPCLPTCFGENRRVGANLTDMLSLRR